MFACECLAFLAAIIKFAWLAICVFAGLLMFVPPFMLDVAIASVLYWTQVVLASNALVEFPFVHALQMLLYLDFYSIPVCMTSLCLFTAT